MVKAGAADAVGGSALTASAADPWPRNDLLRRLELALRIADRAVAHLGETGYRDEDPEAGSFGPDKPLAESAMLLHVAHGLDGAPAIQEAVRALSLRIAPLARSERVACAIALHPSICFQLAMPHILLSSIGLPDSRFDNLLSLSVSASAQRGRELVPHRVLEVLWLRTLWSGSPAEAAKKAAAAASVMNHDIDLLWGSREDAYAFTHTFMYFTGFGSWLHPLPRPVEAILAVADGLLARSLLLEDFDLAAEVLMVGPMLGAPWTPTAAFGLRVLAELEDETGYLPAGNGVPEKYAQLEGADRTRYAIAASYHTAIVMGILCALAARPVGSPPRTFTAPPANGHLADDLQSVLPDADTPWQRSWHRMPLQHKQALGPLLVDMALLQLLRQHDYGAAGLWLTKAAQQGLARSAVCAQTAELLQRLSACAQVHHYST